MSPVTKDRQAFWTTEKKRKYENAMSLLIRQIEIIDKEIFINQGSHIIRHKEKRLKSEESIKEKLERKGGKDEVTNIEKLINDLAGVRVICFDTRQVYMLVNEIKKLKEFIVIKEKDYISHPKESGYQSYHMLFEVMGVKVELQIRTILMDAWSSLETVLIYKKHDIPPVDVVEKINKFSKWSKKMDRMVEEMIEEKRLKK